MSGRGGASRGGGRDEREKLYNSKNNFLTNKNKVLGDNRQENMTKMNRQDQIKKIIREENKDRIEENNVNKNEKNNKVMTYAFAVVAKKQQITPNYEFKNMAYKDGRSDSYIKRAVWWYRDKTLNMESYSEALVAKYGTGCVKMIFQSAYRKIEAFVENEIMAIKMSEEGIVINGIMTKINLTNQGPIKVFIKNIMPWISEQEIGEALKPYGEVIQGSIAYIPVRFGGNENDTISSGQISLYINKRIGVLLPNFITPKISEDYYRWYMAPITVQCFNCGEWGHWLRFCGRERNEEEIEKRRSAGVELREERERKKRGEEETERKKNSLVEDEGLEEERFVEQENLENGKEDQKMIDDMIHEIKQNDLQPQENEEMQIETQEKDESIYDGEKSYEFRNVSHDRVYVEKKNNGEILQSDQCIVNDENEAGQFENNDVFGRVIEEQMRQQNTREGEEVACKIANGSEINIPKTKSVKKSNKRKLSSSGNEENLQISRFKPEVSNTADVNNVDSEEESDYQSSEESVLEDKEKRNVRNVGDVFGELMENNEKYKTDKIRDNKEFLEQNEKTDNMVSYDEIVSILRCAISEGGKKKKAYNNSHIKSYIKHDLLSFREKHKEALLDQGLMEEMEVFISKVEKIKNVKKARPKELDKFKDQKNKDLIKEMKNLDEPYIRLVPVCDTNLTQMVKTIDQARDSLLGSEDIEPDFLEGIKFVDLQRILDKELNFFVRNNRLRSVYLFLQIMANKKGQIIDEEIEKKVREEIRKNYG